MIYYAIGIVLAGTDSTCCFQYPKKMTFLKQYSFCNLHYLLFGKQNKNTLVTPLGKGVLCKNKERALAVHEARECKARGG